MKQLANEVVAQVRGVLQRSHGLLLRSRNTDTAEQIVQAIAALDAAQPVQVNEWRAAVTDALVAAHLLTTENAIHPRKAVQDVIDWNCQVALDPRVSLKARALVDSGKPVPEVNARLVEALERLLNAEHDPYLTVQGVRNLAYQALTAAKQAQPVCGYDDETGNCTRVNCCKQAQPARPINCGTGHCSCIECPYEQAHPERAPSNAIDAKRYRYWRENHGWTGYFDDGATNSESNDDVDKAIDAAIEQGGQHE